MPLANTFYTTQEVASKLGVSRGRISQICTSLRADGQSIGTMVGNSLVFTDLEIRRLKAEIRPRGRPEGSRDKSPRKTKTLA